MDTMTIGIIFGAIMIAVKIFDYFLSKEDKKEFDKIKEIIYSARAVIEADISRLKENNNNKFDRVVDLIERMDTTTKSTLSVVQKTDSDGTPLCFVPRSWADTQGKIVEALDNISKSQVIIAKTLENIEKNQYRGDNHHG